MTSIDSGFDPASLPDDDLEAELPPLRRRRRLPLLTAALALAVVAAGAFIGGVEIAEALRRLLRHLRQRPPRSAARRGRAPRLRRRGRRRCRGRGSRAGHGDQGHDALRHRRERQHGQGHDRRRERDQDRDRQGELDLARRHGRDPSATRRRTGRSPPARSRSAAAAPRRPSAAAGRRLRRRVGRRLRRRIRHRLRGWREWQRLTGCGRRRARRSPRLRRRPGGGRGAGERLRLRPGRRGEGRHVHGEDDAGAGRQSASSPSAPRRSPNSQAAKRADVRQGACVTANGQAAKDGTVTAVRITLSTPVQGQVHRRLRRPPARLRERGTGSARPARRSGPRRARARRQLRLRRRRRHGRRGSTVTVKGPRGTTKVTLSKTTQITRTVEATSAADPREAVRVRPRHERRQGKTVKAQQIALTQPTATGCMRGFRRPGA